jgi:nucleotide-binding universal stress UspA family protein
MAIPKGLRKTTIDSMMKSSRELQLRQWEMSPMFRKSNVLLPTDFSHYALYAMKYAVAIARKYEGTVHILHVLDSSLFSVGSGHGFWLTKADAEKLLESMHVHAENRLDQLKRIAEEEGVDAEFHIVQGKPASEIIGKAEEFDCDMVVIATHGRTGFDHVVFGSVCEKVVRSATVPVLCIKHPEREFVGEQEHRLRLDRIMFPTDFSPCADRAFPYATSLCREFDASLVIFHASEVPTVLPEFMPDAATSLGGEMEEHAREAVQRLAEECEGIDVEQVVETGVAYREICKAVQERNIDLVVMPAHGGSGFVRMLFGSVTEKVIRLSSCPVLAVRGECPAIECVNEKTA